MPSEKVILLHGYASSANSRKSVFLREKFKQFPQVDFHAMDFNPTPKDFEYMTVTGMINRLRQFLLDQQWGNFNIIGSSMGALVGLNYGHRFGGVKGLLLLAPALSYSGNLADTDLQAWKEKGVMEVHHYAFNEKIPIQFGVHEDGQQYHQFVPPPAPIAIIHGRFDDVVPIENSRAYAKMYPKMVKLLEVDSDHRLGDQLEIVWEQIRSMLLDEYS